MEDNRLLEIAVGSAQVYTKVLDYYEQFWKKVNELNMTTWEIQEMGLKRYEVDSYSSNPGNETEDVIIIWDNLTDDSIPELFFESRKMAEKKIKLIEENDLKQDYLRKGKENKMEYNRLLEIATGFAQVCTETTEPDEYLWRKVKELKMTTREMQEVGLKRFEVYPDSSNPKGGREDVFSIWDNLISAKIPGLFYDSRKTAEKKIKLLEENELKQ